MAEDPTEIPHIVADPWALDDLELIRQGVDSFLRSTTAPFALSGPPPRSDELILLEPEGVPLARVRVESTDLDNPLVHGTACVRDVVRWLEPRPSRPFEWLHRSIAEAPPVDVTIVVDEAVDTAAVRSSLEPGPDGRTRSFRLLVAASVEREGAAVPGDVALVRHARAVARSVASDDLVVVPIAADHPARNERIRQCADAYAAGGGSGTIVRLDGASSPESSRGTGAVMFFTGLSGSGKSTLARAVRNRLVEGTDRTVTLLDGDVIRRHLSAGLGFGADDRNTNIRRIGWVAARIAEHDGLAICSPIAPFAATRQAVRSMVEDAGGRFVLVHVATPLDECERRDRKGLYARARRGEIPDFTGISSPYEEPLDADMRFDTTGLDVDPIVDMIIAYGVDAGLWPPPDLPSGT